MALSIKNPRTEELARELADLESGSITSAITHALEERLEKVKGSRRITPLFDEIMAISERSSSLPVMDPRTPDAILGYGAEGAPQ